jgi:hypothetical protein
MTTQNCAQFATAAIRSHELRFASLYHLGRGVVVPCDEFGRVDLDSLSERQRVVYFGARAMIGREYLYPTVQCRH